MRNLPRVLALAAGIAAGCTSLAQAADADRSVLGVSARILPSATFEVQLDAPPLVISRDDIRRGYVQITVNSRFGMSTTLHAIRYLPGYVVEFVPRSDIFTSVLVMAPSQSQPRTASASPTNAFDERADYVYRFHLADNVAPGNYSWPVSVNVEL